MSAEQAELHAQSVLDWSQTAVVIPTRNAKRDWPRLVAGLRLQGVPSDHVLVIDSESSDGIPELAIQQGFQLHRILSKDFNHGGTRQLAVSLLPWAKILVYLTQDAELADAGAMRSLLSVFADPKVGAAYGRQLPKPGAGAIEAHARIFNYPPRTEVRTYETRQRIGIKATFLSNSFSAFRVEALCAVGGFPVNVIMAEDALVAGRMLLAGWKTAYVAEAKVYHSHGYGFVPEFQRYFDIGVYHRREPWLLERFGKPEGEGGRFVRSELSYLRMHAWWRIPEAMFRSVLKAVGYQLGLREHVLGRGLSRQLSLHKGYWDAH